jgi:rubredoxin
MGAMTTPRPQDKAHAARDREFHCDRCGYGAMTATPPERCPMCGGVRWTELHDRRPLRNRRELP